MLCMELLQTLHLGDLGRSCWLLRRFFRKDNLCGKSNDLQICIFLHFMTHTSETI